LERLLDHLSHQGVKQITVCSNGDGSLLEKSINSPKSIQLNFLDESLPVGTAGCIRDAANGDTDSIFIICRAAIVSLPDVDMLIRAHRLGKSELTAIFEPDPENGNQTGKIADIYICEPEVVDYIPQKGFSDIKENLIPAMTRAGKTVHTSLLTRSVGNFRDRPSYLAAISNYLEENNTNPGLPHKKLKGSKNMWLGDKVNIDPSARIHGPVVLMDGASVLEKAIILGPAVIGPNATIGRNTLINNSIFWADSATGQNCEIHSSVIDYNTIIPDNKAVEDQGVIRKRNGKFINLINKAVSLTNSIVEKLRLFTQTVNNKVNAKLPASIRSEKQIFNILTLLGTIILTGVFLWSYWPEFIELWKIWQRSDEYSSGLLVPFIALYILWARREKIAQCHIHPSMWGLLAFIWLEIVRQNILGAPFFMPNAAVSTFCS
jgi:NDP-sugar pyrophosphorylase family protein